MPSEADACCVGGQSVFHVEQITEVLRAAERGSTAKMTTGITRTSTTTTTAGRATTTRAPEGLPTTASLSIYLSICLSLCPQRLWLPMIVRLRTIVTTNKGTLECIRHRCGRLQRHGAITMKSGPSRGVVPARCFSKDSNNTGNNETLRESVGRIKGDTSDDKDGKGASGGSYTDTGDGSSSGGGDTLRNAASMWQSFSEEVGKTWAELVQSGQRKDINKTIIKPSDTDAGPSTEYTGPLELMVIDESENLTAWERMQKRLTEAPIIQGILDNTNELYEKSGARKVKHKLDELSEDAREAWETSQNPWVYRISSVYDTVTAESEYAVAVGELQKLDPEFTLEDWKEDVVEYTLPRIMQWFLAGEISRLEPWLGEGVFKRIAAEITARKKEGVEIDTHVLGIMNSEILAVEPDTVEKGSPIILLHFMCQQINCVRKKEDGTIVEGAEDDIKANSYVAAFQREYNEEKGELRWKIIDFRFNGAIAYL